MEAKSRLFIYDRKEMSVLILLGIMVALFAFTLGVHLGKRVGPRGVVATAPEAKPLQTQADEVPNRQVLTEQAKGTDHAVEETMNQETHDEVSRTGIKLDTPRQVDLPKAAKAEQAPTTPAVSEVNITKTADESEKSVTAAKREAPEGKYTLQVGAFATLAETRDRIDALEALGLKPYMRSVDLKKKGKWFRVYLGGFGTKEEGDEAGSRYQAKHVIDSFLVVQAPSDK